MRRIIWGATFASQRWVQSRGKAAAASGKSLFCNCLNICSNVNTSASPPFTCGGPPGEAHKRVGLGRGARRGPSP